VISFRAIEDTDVEAVAALWRVCGLMRNWNDPQGHRLRPRRRTSTILVGEAEGAITTSVMVGHDSHHGMLYMWRSRPGIAARLGQGWCAPPKPGWSAACGRSICWCGPRTRRCAACTKARLRDQSVLCMGRKIDDVIRVRIISAFVIRRKPGPTET
jgi:hypothetical protein